MVTASLQLNGTSQFGTAGSIVDTSNGILFAVLTTRPETNFRSPGCLSDEIFGHYGVLVNNPDWISNGGHTVTSAPDSAGFELVLHALQADTQTLIRRSQEGYSADSAETFGIPSGLSTLVCGALDHNGANKGDCIIARIAAYGIPSGADANDLIDISGALWEAGIVSTSRWESSLGGFSAQGIYYPGMGSLVEGTWTVPDAGGGGPMTFVDVGEEAVTPTIPTGVAP